MSSFYAFVLVVLLCSISSLLGAEYRVNYHTFSLYKQDLKEEIDIRLSKVQDIKYEPQLLADDDARLLELETQGNQGM